MHMALTSWKDGTSSWRASRRWWLAGNLGGRGVWRQRWKSGVLDIWKRKPKLVGERLMALKSGWEVLASTSSLYGPKIQLLLLRGAFKPKELGSRGLGDHSSLALASPTMAIEGQPNSWALEPAACRSSAVANAQSMPHAS